MPGTTGQPIDRIDGRLNLTGRATYAHARRIPNAFAAFCSLSQLQLSVTASDFGRTNTQLAGYLGRQLQMSARLEF